MASEEGAAPAHLTWSTGVHLRLAWRLPVRSRRAFHNDETRIHRFLLFLLHNLGRHGLSRNDRLWMSWEERHSNSFQGLLAAKKPGYSGSVVGALDCQVRGRQRRCFEVTQLFDDRFQMAIAAQVCKPFN
jgi:hypothetical protein